MMDDDSYILGFLALRQCESNVCLNGGTCKVNDQDRSFQCLCPFGFEGLLCESEKICSLKCQNNGVCIFTDDGKSKCNCLEGIRPFLIYQFVLLRFAKKKRI